MRKKMFLAYGDLDRCSSSGSSKQFIPVLRIHAILVRIWIHGSVDPYLGPTDPDPAIFVIELQDGN